MIIVAITARNRIKRELDHRTLMIRCNTGRDRAIYHTANTLFSALSIARCDVLLMQHDESLHRVSEWVVLRGYRGARPHNAHAAIDPLQQLLPIYRHRHDYRPAAVWIYLETIDGQTSLRQSSHLFDVPEHHGHVT